MRSKPTSPPCATRGLPQEPHDLRTQDVDLGGDVLLAPEALDVAGLLALSAASLHDLQRISWHGQNCRAKSLLISQNGGGRFLAYVLT